MRYNARGYGYLRVILYVLCLVLPLQSLPIPSLALDARAFMFGTSFVHWQGQIGSDGDAALAKSIGATAIRIHSWSAWKEVEYGNGSYDWHWLDDRVANVLAHGMKVYAVTPSLTPEGIPNWAGDLSVNTKVVVDRLLDFTDVMVNRYAGKISYWQMGNELDWQKETSTWLTTDLMDYYFKTTYEIIRQSDLGAKIVVNSAQGTSRVTDFFRGLISRGANFDIIGIDPYVATAAQTGWDSSPEVYLRSNIEAVVGFGKPIIVPEIGVYWFGPHHVEFEVEMLRRSFSVLKEYPQVVGAFWYPYETMMYSPWYWFGLADPNQETVTPVYDTYKSTIELWNTAIVTSSTTTISTTSQTSTTTASTTSTWTTTTTSTSTTTTTSTSSTVSTTTSTTAVSATSTTRTSSATVTKSVTVYTSRSATSTGGKQPTTITCDVSRFQDSKSSPPRLGVSVTGRLAASNVGVPKRDLIIYYSIKGYSERSVKVATDSQGNFGTTIYSEVQNTIANVDKVEFLGDEMYLPSTWPRARSGMISGTVVAAPIPVTTAIEPLYVAE